MKKIFLTLPLFILAVLVPVMAQQLPALVAQQGYADLVLVNGKIVSMEDRSTTPGTTGRVVDAMAIKGKRIMALGTEQEMRALSGSDTRFVNVGGKTVIPGLIQTHYHIFGTAARVYGPQLGLVDESTKLTVMSETTAEATAVKVRDAILNAIRVQQIPAGDWITVILTDNPANDPGTTRTWLYRGSINRRQFDGSIQEHPIMVSGRAAGILNQVAISEFKTVFPDWEESTNLENRPGADVDGYAAVPELQGLTFEMWWRDEPLEKIAEAMRLQGLDLQKKGITTIATRILFPRVIAAFHKLNREGRMPHRMAYYIESQRGNFWNLKTMREFYKGAGAPWTTHAAGNEMVWLNGMCNEIWDSTQNELCMGDDVDVSPEIRARERCPAPGTKPWETYRQAIVHGWRPVQAHNTSSHGARLYLQMMEQAMKEGGYSVEYMKSLRSAVEHNQLLGQLPEIMDGFKKFGIIINVNTGYLREIPHNLRDYGEQLRPFIMPVKTWIDEGIRVTFEASGTDFWRPIYRLVTREVVDSETQEKVILNLDEAVDRVTALKMVTTWGSEYMMAEDTIGTLEPGKFADFVVLDRDFFTIPVEEIPNVKVVLTGLGGGIVFDEEQLVGN
ncbi:MAG: amidohydrolase family protein [Acidobacteriota bacterium]|nr:amidohydrolase family protein [Acidobacteriota bacterium]